MNLIRKVKGFFRQIERRIHNQSDIQGLVERGMKIGKDVHIDHRVIFDKSHCWLITICDEVTFAPCVHVLAHDASTKRHLGYTKIGRVTIKSKTFIGANSIILPGVTIGENVIIGAGSVVTGNIPDGVVAVGVPAKVIGTTGDYIARHREELRIRPLFPRDIKTEASGILSPAKKIEIFNALNDGMGYIQ
jgi:maltose O-acetyltransferase